jgi:hypothetical protein
MAVSGDTPAHRVGERGEQEPTLPPDQDAGDDAAGGGFGNVRGAESGLLRQFA